MWPCTVNVCFVICVLSVCCVFCDLCPVSVYVTVCDQALFCQGTQLLEHKVYSVARLYPDRSFLSLCHRHRVAGISMLYKVNSNSSVQ